MKADVLIDIKIFPFVWVSLSKQMVGSYQVSALKRVSWRNHNLATKPQFFKKEKLPRLNTFLAWYLRMKQVTENWQLPDLLMWSVILQVWAAAAAKQAPSKAELHMLLNVSYQVGFRSWCTLLCSSKKEITWRNVTLLILHFSFIQLTLFSWL